MFGTCSVRKIAQRGATVGHSSVKRAADSAHRCQDAEEPARSEVVKALRTVLRSIGPAPWMPEVALWLLVGLGLLALPVVSYLQGT